MRVITGRAKGVRLVTPDGLDVRPTVDRVKEAIFSSLQFDIEGRTVLDLFAGSGQMGIEALSRGAKLAIFIDKCDTSLNCVKQNLKNTNLFASSRVIKSDSLTYLKGITDKIDIAFLDPPYHNGIINNAMSDLVKHMSNHGVIVCEYSITDELQDQYGDFVKVKNNKYGKIKVSFYRKLEDNNE